MTEERQPGVAEKAYTIKEAAVLKSVSPDLIRRAIHATEPPFIRAKQVGRGYHISAAALEDWWEMLPDA